jgi:hypothetical protein
MKRWDWLIATHHPGKAKPYPGLYHIEALHFYNPGSRFAWRDGEACSR